MAFPIIRCGIVDDKPLAIEVLRAHITHVPFLTLVQATTNPLEVLTHLSEEPIDLLFLDIQMPQLNGLQLARLIAPKVRLIFTTAYADYALEGFEHSAVDYLLKPISFERFYKAVLKARALITSLASTVALPPTTEPNRPYFFVKTETRLVKVDFRSVRYIEAMQNYSVLHLTEGRLMTLQPIHQLVQQLPATQFVRVHKSYVVNLDQIDSVERSRICIGQAIIPVGDTYRDDFYRRLTN
ncbi:LytR/AlgR family response regulator transcription factor [Spirosoma radiotolerans]|uniref:Chemotaxis protein CheY n=1 Tax=Spirosoma radiotolerans TaxID=1379870 RepID=A0A0E3V9H4_9BACT|nr:LytTR family DNA-binding domain-containing protein [Spirosoma radiotolerans]AKD57146.1 hypothetical protein SD10_21865 [Spirosoma radiotolerans]